MISLPSLLLEIAFREAPTKHPHSSQRERHVKQSISTSSYGSQTTAFKLAACPYPPGAYDASQLAVAVSPLSRPYSTFGRIDVL
ncbi:hypothetical protein RSOLAG1IB_10371 [Rhizoctonia solani AG-1 IB]|uniref:Uncharacterized protein n=1 Tax=Thanatephorus cucumeris (strain AG1-IB / isolate 7/3/14) TaxID=1108050 RepID=A0A0B7G1H6_THACB|nr:hypothetical protein RSOLAG1IB_10371 [Rhizoctonia solani AG-1 IB]